MSAINQITNEQLKIIIDKANTKPIAKRGRPKKYHTEEERRTAKNQLNLKYRQQKKDKFNAILKQLEELQNKNKDNS